MKKSTSAGEKVSVRLSPPLSISTTSPSGNRASMSSTAARFMLGSSRTAVCGQAPVSTPMMRSSSRMPFSVRWTCFASSVVTTSLVMMRILMPISRSGGVMASTMAVLPEPTGPPMPMRVIFFTGVSLRVGNQFMNKRTCALTWTAARISASGAKPAMSSREAAAAVAYAASTSALSA